jgi:lipopolysaccharide biosynthesis regulator YciM
MADDVTIKFTADVSGLQQGMQQATSAVEATTSALRSGATQINASFAVASLWDRRGEEDRNGANVERHRTRDRAAK